MYDFKTIHINDRGQIEEFITSEEKGIISVIGLSKRQQKHRIFLDKKDVCGMNVIQVLMVVNPEVDDADVLPEDLLNILTEKSYLNDESKNASKLIKYNYTTNVEDEESETVAVLFLMLYVDCGQPKSKSAIENLFKE